MSGRCAVLVDGDNIAAKHEPFIRRVAVANGATDIRRVYADTAKRKDWCEVHGFRLMHAGTGKNGADILLSIDAMEFALRDGIDAFVIASSDADFSHLAMRLRELGSRVIGIGEPKTPAAFQRACTGFELIEPAQGAVEPTDMDRKIRAVIAEHSTNGAGMRIAELAPKMHQRHGLRISTLPERTWRAYLSRRRALYDLDPRGTDAMVRFLPDGFSASRA